MIEQKLTSKKSLSKSTSKNAYTYMLLCADGSLYTGWTNDLANRLKTHNAGKGAKYTKSRLPAKLVYFEIHESKSQAMKRESSIKRLSKLKKMLLIEDFSKDKLKSFT